MILWVSFTNMFHLPPLVKYNFCYRIKWTIYQSETSPATETASKGSQIFNVQQRLRTSQPYLLTSSSVYETSQPYLLTSSSVHELYSLIYSRAAASTNVTSLFIDV
jgi:hypothetical protein